MTLQRSTSATLVLMDHSGPRLTQQLSMKERTPASRASARSELCLHSIPAVLVLCFLLLWVVSSDVKSPVLNVGELLSPGTTNAAEADSQTATRANSPPAMSSVIKKVGQDFTRIRSGRKVQHRHARQ